MIITKIKADCPKCKGKEAEAYKDPADGKIWCHCLICDEIFELKIIKKPDDQSSRGREN